MRSCFVRTTLAAAVAACAATPAAAQIRIPPVQLVLGMGPSQAASLGYIDGIPARHLSSNALMVGVQTQSPVRGVDLRLTLQDSHPYLMLYDAVTNRTQITTLSLDALVHLPHVAGAQPYLLVGGGLKRYDFDQARFRLDQSAVIPRDEVDAMLHAGLGVAWNLGKADVFLEAAGSSNHFQNNPTSPFGHNAQNYTWTLGIRIPLHR